MSDAAIHPPSPPSLTSVNWQLRFTTAHEVPVFSVNIDSARFRVGRRESADLVLPSPQISGLHAEFVVVGMRLFVRDLASTNGTYVNGKRIGYRDVALRHGDHLRMANVEFIVHRDRPEHPAGDTALLQKRDGEFVVDKLPLHDPASVFDADRG